MHKKQIVHRDIKPDNMMMIEGDMDFPIIKLIDFGTSLTFTPGDRFKSKIGTPTYMAPEILVKDSEYTE